MDRLIIYPYWILKYQNEAKNAVFSELIIYPYWILNCLRPQAVGYRCYL